MCDPITIAALAVGVAGSAAQMFQSQPKPPEPAALTPPPVVADKPVVKLGQSNATTTDNYTPTSTFTEKRTEAFSLGNIGRSGLSL